jgi:hypothetical protein
VRFVCLFRLKNTGHHPPGEQGSRDTLRTHTVHGTDRRPQATTVRASLDLWTSSRQDIEDTVGGHMGSPVDGSKPLILYKYLLPPQMARVPTAQDRPDRAEPVCNATPILP